MPAALAQGADGAHQFQRRMLSPSQVLDQAHDETIVFGGVDHDSGNRLLAKRYEGLQPSLPADEIIARSSEALADLRRQLRNTERARWRR